MCVCVPTFFSGDDNDHETEMSLLTSPLSLSREVALAAMFYGPVWEGPSILYVDIRGICLRKSLHLITLVQLRDGFV